MDERLHVVMNVENLGVRHGAPIVTLAGIDVYP